MEQTKELYMGGKVCHPKKYVNIKVNKHELITLILQLPVHQWYWNLATYDKKEDKYHWNIKDLEILGIEDLQRIYTKCKEEKQYKPASYYRNKNLEMEKKCSEFLTKLSQATRNKRELAKHYGEFDF